tara:strand:+ start:149 stop:319 length:171 start_codon:yes stop_codon:yes gene_type:complete
LLTPHEEIPGPHEAVAREFYTPLDFIGQPFRSPFKLELRLNMGFLMGPPGKKSRQY